MIGIRRSSSKRTLTLGLGLIPNYWIDATNGDDGNSGATKALAWKSLNKIVGSLAGAGTTKVVRVVTDTYDTASDWFEATINTGSHLIVVFEPGCVMDGTASNASAAQNPIYIDASGTCTCTVYGNGLTVQHYNSEVGGSPNGIGYGGSGLTLNAHSITVDDAVDGISGHSSSHLNAYDCVVNANNLKWTVANVDTSTMNAYRCVFNSSAAASGGFIQSANGLQYFEDCKFIPATGKTNTILGDNQQFKRCQLGSLTDHVEPVQKTTGTSTLLVEDSFVNVDIQAFPNITYRRCYGFMSARIRAGTGDYTVERCVLSANASGGGAGICYCNFTPGSSCRWVFRNNIIETATAAKFQTLTATHAGYLVGSASQFFNNIISGSAAFDADLVSADSGGTVIVDNVTADALIGAANTLDPDDYGYGTGSPAIGAATDSGNCGFAVGEVEQTRPIKVIP